jgi:hypothetical protein
MAPLEIGRLTSFKTKLDIALRLMDTKGIRRVRYIIPLYRLLWFLNVPIRPPQFAGFAFNAIFFTLYFCAICALSGWFATWMGQRIPIAIVFGIVASAPIYGVLLAAYYRSVARRYKLPAWAELSNEAEIFD